MKKALFISLLPFMTLDARITTSVEYLYWKGEEGIEWATLVDADFTPDSFEDADVHSIPLGWDSGVRVHFAYDRPCQQWTLLANYTYFYGENRDHLKGSYNSTTSIGSFAVPTFGLFDLPLPTFNGQTEVLSTTEVIFKGSLTYNQFNLLAGITLEVDPKLSFTPYAGLRGLFIKQKITNNFYGEGTDSSTLLPFDAYQTFSYNSHFSGYGAAFGFNTLWSLFSQLSLYVDLGMSLLATFNNVRMVTNLSNTDNNPNLALNNKLYELGYTLDGTLALQWSCVTKTIPGILSLRAGWEWHTISDQNRLPIFNNAATINSQSLTLQGLIIGIGYAI